MRLIAASFALVLLLTACGDDDAATDATDATEETGGEESVGMGNPASIYCEEQGGTEETREDAEGNQSGVCVFEDGSECDSWAYFREECAPGDQPGGVAGAMEEGADEGDSDTDDADGAGDGGEAVEE